VVDSTAFVDDTRRFLTFLIGSAEQRMQSPFALRIGASQYDPPDAVVLGQFDGDASTMDAAAFTEGLASTSASTPGIWALPGVGDGQWKPPHRTAMASGFDARCAVFAVGRLRPTDHSDTIVAVDAGSACYGGGGSPAPLLLVARMSDDGAGHVTAAVTTDLVDAPYTVPNHIAVADLDGDGYPEVIVSYMGEWFSSIDSTATQVPGAGVVIYWNRNGVLSASDPAARTELAVFPGTPNARIWPLATAALNADAKPDEELAVLTNVGVFLARPHAGMSPAFVLDQTPAAPADVAYGAAIEARDLDGDGLDDVVFSGSNQVFVFLAHGATLGDASAK
jgi:hypothetical protein